MLRMLVHARPPSAFRGGRAWIILACSALSSGALPGASGDVGPARVLDAAILTAVLPGSYSLLVSDWGGASGRIPVEVYELP